MTPDEFLPRVVLPGLALLPVRMRAIEAQCFLVAVGGQEGGWMYRRQLEGGTAHGFFQCEGMGGACGEVVTSPHTAPYARAVCAALDIDCTVEEVYQAIVYCDALSSAIARLIPWPDPAPLAALGDEEGAWQVYKRGWKPGRPDRVRWAGCYAAALEVVTGAAVAGS